MRRDTNRNDVRSSALWGKRSGSREGRKLGRRGFAAALVAGLVMLAGPLAGVADASGKDHEAYVTPTLLERAEANGDRLFDVIVQSDGTMPSAALAGMIVREGGGTATGQARVRSRIKDEFDTVSAVAVTLSGKQILRLADRRGVYAITPDAPVELSNYSNKQLWPLATGLAKVWPSMANGTAGTMPAIAVVDSGIDSSRNDFGGRVIVEKTMTSLAGNSPGDGRGHGTFVAGIAAGSAPGYAGAAPSAPIVSLDVMDDKGMAMTSDVIAAADWIHANRRAYDIRVANFSLHSSVPNSFMYDPLSKAVERLWFAGVVVVAASGNYGVANAPSGVPFAPGNDPFIITVGALDLGEKLNVKDDGSAPWSAYGYTLDGFLKPEVGAPGRYMIGPVPATSTLALERPEQLRAAGYIELSGTSFAAPLVSGMAAYILARNPTWTPDQVKGALMLTATHMPSADFGSVGVGFVSADKAAAVKDPPNPNLALNAFLVSDPAGSGDLVFDSASWAHVAKEDASWASASWANASWANASWANASWASASWASASWASASWASASWANASWAAASWASASWASASWANTAEAAASWANASWASVSYEDNAAGEGGIGGLVLTPEEEAFLLGLLDDAPAEEPALEILP